MSVASAFLTLADIAAPTGRPHPSPAGPQSARKGCARIECVRTTGFCLIGPWV
jgi:hypothetical protein